MLKGILTRFCTALMSTLFLFAALAFITGFILRETNWFADAVVWCIAYFLGRFITANICELNEKSGEIICLEFISICTVFIFVFFILNVLLNVIDTHVTAGFLISYVLSVAINNDVLIAKLWHKVKKIWHAKRETK